MPKTSSENGFTLVEAIIAIAIIGVLSGLSVPYFNSFLARNELKNESLKVVDALRTARIRAITGHSDSAWGVHFESNKYVVFKGNAYNASDPFNSETVFPAVLSFATTTLNGGGSDVIFNKISGETSQYGTTTIQNDINESNDIVINRIGMIEMR